MKYALNHQGNFINYHNSFLAGLTYCFVSLVLETISLLIILISDSILDIVFNFIALAVIAEFDSFVVKSVKNSLFEKALEPENSE